MHRTLVQTQVSAPKKGVALAVLLELEKRARAAPNTEQLGFLIVNESVALVPYRQAVLFSESGKVSALSGLAVPDPNAPYVDWCRRVAKVMGTGDGGLRCFSAADMTADLRSEWAQWWPQSAVWMPLAGAGALLLANDAPPDEPTLKLLDYLSDAYAHALRGLQRRRGGGNGAYSGGRRRLVVALLSVVLAVLAFMPVTDSAMGQLEMVARDPLLVRAPLEGVIDSLYVQPNEIVRSGDPLLRLDDTRLRSRLQAALKNFEVADAEFRLTSQLALLDREAAARVQVLLSRREQAEAEVTYLQELLHRIVVSAPRDGLVFFDNVNDLLGRPVVIGEQIMQIADPLDAEIEIRLPVKDAIELPDQASVRVFLNVDPHRPREAVVRYASYQAIPGADGILAYRLLALPAADGLPLRVGQKGTARIEGHPTVLFIKLFRRPLTTARQALGW